MRDPLDEVLEVALRTDDAAEPGQLDGADAARLRLARRRFGVSLPPPWVPPPADPARLPVRPAGPGDGAAIAAIQRRAWRVRYRGLLPDPFLDALDFSHLGPRWIRRAGAASSDRQALLVAGRPGEVYGMVDAGPALGVDGGLEAQPDLGEVRSLYLDPTVTGRGLGGILLEAAVAALAGNGFHHAVLWVIAGNQRARAFYERWGWRPDGATTVTPVQAHHVDEVRYRRAL